MKKRVTLTFPKKAVHMPVTYRLAKDCYSHFSQKSRPYARYLSTGEGF